MDPGPMALFCNKEVLDRAGVGEHPRTWDEYYEAARKTKAAGSYIEADAGDAGFFKSMIWAFGGYPYSASDDGRNVTINLTGDKGTQRFIYYFGTFFFYQPIVDTATLTVEPEESGRVLGFNDLLQAITGSIGVSLFGQLMANGSMGSGSLAGTKAGLASTYANVFMIGGVIILAGMVLFICSMKMIYSHSRVAEDED